MPKTERTIAATAVGWFLVVGASYLLALTIAPAMPDLLTGDDYLSAMLKRSIFSLFQAPMLVGWIALVPHAAWLAARHPTRETAIAYDTFGAWAQTLFTSFGFMGTVVGISVAVAGLRQAMDAGDPSALIGGLYTAFDTTFLGLSGALTIMFFRKAARLWLDT
ncbi:MotA/TolQ/ExbB proton channel family protein [Blastochloris sulfoviridis]|uniref:MotA/TolQ/ExbB proton channel family protein n=1 Tax=Blastochloris sulfoviridis TaxID=50712 RepID=A0A5M6HQU9_9HYPH|nr:MotA/TolQ/ExbB proton channel family protein [Blastochloris sulfoviridis]KAA5598226.1 MotA/TolQ/ExbB proton channel family protein [Blastochloris sulfoviridis]